MALCVENADLRPAERREARAKLQAVLGNGKAAKSLVYGGRAEGPSDFVENYDKYLPTAMLRQRYADTEGFISAMDTATLGMAVRSSR